MPKLLQLPFLQYYQIISLTQLILLRVHHLDPPTIIILIVINSFPPIFYDDTEFFVKHHYLFILLNFQVLDLDVFFSIIFFLITAMFYLADPQQLYIILLYESISPDEQFYQLLSQSQKLFLPSKEPLIFLLHYPMNLILQLQRIYQYLIAMILQISHPNKKRKNLHNLVLIGYYKLFRKKKQSSTLW